MIRIFYASPAIVLAAILCIASVPEAFAADSATVVKSPAAPARVLPLAAEDGPWR